MFQYRFIETLVEYLIQANCVPLMDWTELMEYLTSSILDIRSAQHGGANA